MYSVRFCESFSPGKAPTDEDAERIYSNSLSATLDMLPSCSRMIKGDVRFNNNNNSFKNCIVTSGVPQTMTRLRQEFGLKIGSSTGYTSEIMEKLRVGQCVSL